MSQSAAVVGLVDTLVGNSFFSGVFIEGNNWTRALRVGEILHRVAADELSKPLLQIDRSIGAAKLTQWEADLHLDSAELVSQWAADYQADVNEVIAALSIEPLDWKPAMARPDWLNTISLLVQIYDVQECRVPDIPDCTPMISAIIEPWVSWARIQLSDDYHVQGLDNDKEGLDDESGIWLSADSLVKHLSLLVDRTLILDINLQRINGKLSGDTPESRYGYYCDILWTRCGAIEFWRKYVVLARLLTEAATMWVNSCNETITRLHADREMLQHTFAESSSLGSLQSVTVLGDMHCDNRQVSLLSFSNDVSIVYKPRTMDLEAAFHTLFRDQQSQVGHEQTRIPRTLVKENYGWVEFIPSRVSDTKSRGPKSRRYGHLLAFSFFFGATDLIADNIIESEGHPIVIDAECCLRGIHPEELGLAFATHLNSLSSTGVLPGGLIGANGVDVSGIGGRGSENVPPYPVLTGIASGTDEIRVEAVSPMAPENSGTGAPSVDTECVIEGFNEMASSMLASFKTLARNPIFVSATKAKARYIARGTHIYGKVLRASTHPNYLTTAPAREAVLMKLPTSKFDWRNKLSRAERDQLWRFDIPIFWTVAQTADLHTHEMSFPEIMRTTPLSRLERQVANTNERDLRRHAQSIRAALNAQCPSQWIPTDAERATGSGLYGSCVRGRSKSLARSIGVRVMEAAVVSENGVSWMDSRPYDRGGYANGPIGKTEFAPFDDYLYQGTAGALLFFYYAANILQVPEFSSLADQCLAGILQQIFRANPARVRGRVGAYTGVGSLLYLVACLRCERDTPELADAGEILLQLLKRAVKEDDSVDFLGGLAGAACVLLDYGLFFGHTGAFDLAHLCGERLLHMAIRSAGYASWNTGNEVPLVGLAHGGSGIAYALSKLFQASKKTAYRTVAIETIAFESQYYSPARQNWQDRRAWLKQRGADQWNTVAWCSGAPGIGLARSRIQTLLELDLDLDLRAATATTLENSRNSGDDCLCHGRFGNLDILASIRQCQPTLVDSDFLDETYGAALDHVDREGLNFAAGCYSLSLMQGAIGSAWACLRYAARDKLPNPLLLELPKEPVTRNRWPHACNTALREELPPLGEADRSRQTLYPHSIKAHDAG